VYVAVKTLKQVILQVCSTPAPLNLAVLCILTYTATMQQQQKTGKIVVLGE
jgi:hypothetical protein